MKVGIVSLRDIADFDRMDAAFLLLAQEHKAAATELAANFTREEIVSIAKELPYDERAANAVKPGSMPHSQTDFFRWLEGAKTRLKDIIVYTAAACHDAGALFMEDYLAERKKQAEKLKRYHDVVKLVKSKSAPGLADALKLRRSDGGATGGS